MRKKLSEYQFLFEELVKRDFKKKYKRTMLGMVWSVLSPLLMLIVMKVVFTQFFGRDMEHYTTYLFAGNIVFFYFTEATNEGMVSLAGNANIINKVSVPKYMFLLSNNVSSFINFMLTLVVFFIFVVLDGISFSFSFLFLIYPILCLVVFNLGMGLILSGLFVFFKDIQYLYRVFTRLLMYVSAIFYSVDDYPIEYQRLFLFNPIYVYIKSIRIIVIDGHLPSINFLLLSFAYAAIILFFGAYMYKKYNHKFIYYM